MKVDRNSLKIIISYILLILFFLSIILIYYYLIYNETVNRIIKTDELSSITSAENIDAYITKGVETIKLVSFTMDSLIRSNKSEDEIKEFLINQSNAVKSNTADNTNGLYGYIKNNYIDGTGTVLNLEYNPTEYPWYTYARAHIGRVGITEPYVNTLTNKISITFSKVLCDGKSVLAMDYNIDRLQEITEHTKNSGDIEAEIILDQRYNVIAHSTKSEVGKNYIKDSNTLGNAIVNQLRSNNNQYFPIKFNNRKYIAYSTTINNGWYCISVFNATNAFNQLHGTFIFTILISILVVIAWLVALVRTNRRLEQYYRAKDIVKSLTAAIDAKDKYTNGHSSRVANYAKEISKRLGYSKSQQDEIYIMGLLHDVGKIGIPDSLLTKPERLTDEEFEIIKQHPIIGVKILSNSEGTSRLAIGAHYHHEKYDGSGYPEGLSGNNIQKEARIIAVADSYDAMTSSRSYRGILDQSIVRREIEKGKGTQFDPEVADVMIQMIDEDKDYTMHGS